MSEHTPPSSRATDPAAVPTLGEVVKVLERRYPPRIAEDWDVVGLVCGDPAEPVRRILFTVDVTEAVVDEALAAGVDLIVAHHPLLLRPVTSVAATTWKGALVHRLVRGRCALVTAHTNADSAVDGVCEALAQLFGLTGTRPLTPAPQQALDKVVVFVPPAAREAVIDALTGAGAGRLGNYQRCTWRSTGEGTFTPLPGAQPSIGAVGTATSVVEERVELVAPRSARTAIIAALRHAHPYEEPAFDILEMATLASDVGIGRVGSLPVPVSLADFARTVAQVLPPTAQGVRVAGDLAAEITTVAVVGGAGDSLFDAVRASGADVYVTSDLRHHPASELRERAEFEARIGGGNASMARPFLVDTAHYASESPWLALAARDLGEELGVETIVSAVSTDPWTARFDS